MGRQGAGPQWGKGVRQWQPGQEDEAGGAGRAFVCRREGGGWRGGQPGESLRGFERRATPGCVLPVGEGWVWEAGCPAHGPQENALSAALPLFGGGVGGRELLLRVPSLSVPINRIRSQEVAGLRLGSPWGAVGALYTNEMCQEDAAQRVEEWAG